MRNCLFWQLLSLVDPLKDHMIVINDLRNTDKSRFVVKGIQFAAKAANTRVELRMSRAFRQTTFFPTTHKQTCSMLVICR